MATTIGFTTDEALYAQIEKIADGNIVLSAADKAIADRRLRHAYNLIVAALVKRGVAKADVDAWADGADYQLDIATYFYVVNTAQVRQRPGDTDWLDRFDRRDELADVTLLDADGAEVAADEDVAVEVWELEES